MNKRIVELDIMKAIGIFFMIILHVFLWWNLTDDFGTSVVSEDFKEMFLFLKLISFLVFFIPITAGAAFYIYLQKFSKEKIMAAVKRAIPLLALGYLTSVLAFGMDDVLAWDVLHFISISFLFLLIFSYFPLYYLGVFSFITILLAPFLRNLFENLNSNYFIIIIAGNQTGDHYWAFFPWFGFMGFGYLMMYLHTSGIFSKKTFSRIMIVGSLAIIFGSMLLGDFIIKEDLLNLWGPAIFAPPTSRLFANLAIFTIMFIVLTNYSIKSAPKFGVVNSFSKGILWIYIVHLIVGFNFITYMKNYFYGTKYILITTFLLMALAYFVGIIVIKIKSVNEI